MPRKPWEIPVEYVDSRWEEAGASAAPASPPAEDYDPETHAHEDERDARDVDELLNRPDGREEKVYECTNTTPVDYRKGPHDTEFGVNEKVFNDDALNPAVPYENGPHDDELGLTDEEEYEDADPDEEFTEDMP